MQFAIDQYGNKIKPLPKSIGKCQECNGTIIAKCGLIKIWHWSHAINDNCDYANKSETLWHLAWKSLFRDEHTEIKLESGKIADVKLFNNIIVEFQNSRLSAEKINEYEIARPNMIWVFNGDVFCENLSISKINNNAYKFTWKWHPSTLKHCTHPIFLDLDGNSKKIFYIKKMHGKHGWGYLYSRNQFFDKYLRMSDWLFDLPHYDWVLSKKGYLQYNTEQKWRSI